MLRILFCAPHFKLSVPLVLHIHTIVTRVRCGANHEQMHYPPLEQHKTPCWLSEASWKERILQHSPPCLGGGDVHLTCWHRRNLLAAWACSLCGGELCKLHGRASIEYCVRLQVPRIKLGFNPRGHGRTAFCGLSGIWRKIWMVRKGKPKKK